MRAQILFFIYIFGNINFPEKTSIDIKNVRNLISYKKDSV